MSSTSICTKRLLWPVMSLGSCSLCRLSLSAVCGALRVLSVLGACLHVRLWHPQTS